MPLTADTDARDPLRPLVRALRRQARRLADPAEADAVHDARVAARRLETALLLWHALLPRAIERRARHRVRAFRRALGGARDAEVLSQTLAQRTAEAAGMPEAPAALGRALRRLQKELDARAQRRRARGAARADGVRIGRMRRLRQAAARARQRVHGRQQDDATWRARFGAIEARARQQITAGLATGTPEGLHGARLAAKRWRYASEHVAALANLPAAPPELMLLQRALGATLDLTRLAARVRAEIEHGGDAAALVGFAAGIERDAQHERVKAAELAVALSRTAVSLTTARG